MKKILPYIFILFSSVCFGQIYSATDSVIVPLTNDYTNDCRGFDFTPTTNIRVINLGKRIPNTSGVCYGKRLLKP